MDGTTIRYATAAFAPAEPRNVRGGPAANPYVPHSEEPINLATGSYTWGTRSEPEKD